jgi:hypothetical protein
MNIEFKPSILTLDRIQGIYSTEELKYEPMLFSADLEFAKQNGGPLTKKVCAVLEKNNLFRQAVAQKGPYSVVVDTRVTMTFKNQFPSIPGWHCDDIPREKESNPLFEKCDARIKHFLVIFSNKVRVSCTEFVTEPLVVPIDEGDVWNSLHSYVSQQKGVSKRSIVPGEIILFNQLTIHQAKPTVNPGWRFFMRVSITYRKPVNEIRKQVQVYASLDNPGW